MANPLTSGVKTTGGGFPAVRFAGLRFTPMSVDETVGALAGRDPGAPFVAFVTPNAEHAYLRRQDDLFRQCGDTCWISTNDSRILGRAAWLAGLDLKFAPGAYVVDRLFQEVIGKDDPITIVGGMPDVIEGLVAKYGLTQVAHHNPPMGFIHQPEAVREAVAFVATHPGRFVFVAMGPPQSEKFCQHIIADGRATGVGLCIGSSIQVVTGRIDVAPDWMEQSGLVWLYRLQREPGRLWKRYLVRGLFGLGLGLADVLAIRLGGRRPQLDAA